MFWFHGLVPEVKNKTELGKRAGKELQSSYKLGIRDSCHAIAIRVVAASDIDDMEFGEIDKGVKELQVVVLEFLGRIYGSNMPRDLKSLLGELGGERINESLVEKIVRRVKSWSKGAGKVGDINTTVKETSQTIVKESKKMEGT